MSKLLEVEDLSKRFRYYAGLFRKRDIWAVNDVSFGLNRGEILALVGESGSGKSTIGKIILRLEKPTKGRITFDRKDIKDWGKEYSSHVSVVFQDPSSSLNPYMSVKDILEEPLRIHRIPNRKERIERALELANLSIDLIHRKPRELSGGQRQRVAIARAIVLEPKLVVADEPTASLDASVRKGILDLFLELKKSSISVLFITHDIRSVERIADKVGVLYKGMLMELGKKEDVLNSPKHPYTRYLLENVPVRHPSKRRSIQKEELLTSVEEGCPFYPLCSHRLDDCSLHVREVVLDGTLVKCNLY